MGKACQNTINFWRKFTRLLEYHQTAQDSISRIALGRGNWIYVGCTQARPKIAVILSVVESYRRMKIPVRE